MKLLTNELKNRFRKIGCQSKSKDPLVICKFFNACGAGTWLATEYDEDRKLFYGYVSLFNDHCNEWGAFSLNELEDVKTPLGIGIERDLYFNEMPISEAVKKEGIHHPVHNRN